MSEKPEVVLEEETDTAEETGGIGLKRLAILAAATIVLGAIVVFRRKNGPTKEATILPFRGKPTENPDGSKEGTISNSGWESVPLKPL